METSLSHYRNTARLVIEDKHRNEGVGMTVGQLARALKLSRYYALHIIGEMRTSRQVKSKIEGRIIKYIPTNESGLSDKERTMAQWHLEIIHHG